jgi:hypothetical protein
MRALFLAIAAAIALLAAPDVAEAQVAGYANPAKVFVAVDAVTVEQGDITVTGVLQGEAAPSSWRLDLYATAVSTYDLANLCQRAAYLAMARPGQYLLEIFSGTVYVGPYCKLSRVNP